MTSPRNTMGKDVRILMECGNISHGLFVPSVNLDTFLHRYTYNVLQMYPFD